MTAAYALTHTRTRLISVWRVASLLAGAVALAAGYAHTCTLLTGGGVDCWGGNGNGQLGTGDTMDRHTPTAVTGLGTGV